MSDRIQHLIEAGIYQTCYECGGIGIEWNPAPPGIGEALACTACKGRGWVVNPEWVEKAASFVWNKFPRYELNYPEIERIAEAVLLLLDEEDTPQ